MNRAQLTAQIAEKAGVSKAQAGKLLNTVLGCIADNICEGDGEVAIPDFGRFYIKSCQARTGFNPNTKERIEIEAHDKRLNDQDRRILMLEEHEKKRVTG